MQERFGFWGLSIVFRRNLILCSYNRSGFNWGGVEPGKPLNTPMQQVTVWFDRSHIS